MPKTDAMRILSALVMLAAACGGTDDPCGEPEYQGGATDEAWRTMLDGEAHAKVGDPQAATVTAPTQNQMLSSGDSPLLVTWSSPIAKVPHLPPVTSDIYLVRLTVPGRMCPLQLLTTDEHWQLDSADWQAMAQASGQTMSMQITSAYLTENRITEGPYVMSMPRTFTVGP